MPKVVYIETTIPSHYFDRRMEPSMLAYREWTREWWDNRRSNYELVTSRFVRDELLLGSHPNQTEKIQLIEQVPTLAIAPEIPEIVSAYIQNKLMPADVGGDATHVAFASFYNCDYLLTWNCRHIANRNKEEHLRKINQRLGISIPALVTPHDLLSMENSI